MTSSSIAEARACICSVLSFARWIARPVLSISRPIPVAASPIRTCASAAEYCALMTSFCDRNCSILADSCFSLATSFSCWSWRPFTWVSRSWSCCWIPDFRSSACRARSSRPAARAWRAWVSSVTTFCSSCWVWSSRRFLAVTTSACYFAVRVLTDPDVPPCAGAYRPVTVIAPEGSLLNARPPAAVAAGNVETSSRVADLVLAAFGRALGQGTMNNLTLGNDEFTYYETLGGGQGACPDADGPSAVHVAMSNTLNTPIEALEREFPLRAIEYAVRHNSGGTGAHKGGDGVVRELDALDRLGQQREALVEVDAGTLDEAVGVEHDGVARPDPDRVLLEAGERQGAQRHRAAAEGDRQTQARRPATHRDPRRRRAWPQGLRTKDQGPPF